MTTTSTSTFEGLRQAFQAGTQARLPRHIGSLGWNAEQIAAHQCDQLRRLLAHAIQHSPFHAERLRGIEAATFELENLTSLPVMTKAEMMANFDDAVTDRKITRRAVEAHLARTGELPEPFLGNYICTTSGGSSGLRGVFVYSLEAFVDLNLGFIRPGIARMLASGGLPSSMPAVALVAAPTAVHGTRAGSALSDGGVSRVINAPLTLPISEIVSRLNKGQPDVLIGYPEGLRQLAGEQQAGRLSISPGSITATSEQLTPEASRQIEATFGVPVVNSFGSSEGVLGSSAPGQDRIVFASDLAIIELVDQDNRPVAQGVPSARVLVTNLFNLAQPLIRYELTDSFLRQPSAMNHGHLIATVEGRVDEVFDYHDLRIHPLVIRSPLAATPQITEYQVRQTPLGINVDVTVSGSFQEAALVATLSRSLSRAGLQDPQVSIRTVASIERNAQTGKIRRFLPLTGVRAIA